MTALYHGDDGFLPTALTPEAVHCFLLSALCFLPDGVTDLLTRRAPPSEGLTPRAMG